MTKKLRNYENLTKCCFPGVGNYDIPVLHPEKFEKCDLIGFNYAKGCPKERRAETGVHFFLDDYQFQRVWSMPDYYLPMLRQFKYVLTPDFSIYADFPRAIQIYNQYRKHWIGAYLQMHEVRVIPSISWSDEDSFEWCFDGEPTRGAVAVSSVGTQGNKRSRELFLKGYQEMLLRLRPEQIIFYGEIPKECRSEKIIRVTAFQERLKGNRKRGGEEDGIRKH